MRSSLVALAGFAAIAFLLGNFVASIGVTPFQDTPKAVHDAPKPAPPIVAEKGVGKTTAPSLSQTAMHPAAFPQFTPRAPSRSPSRSNDFPPLDQLPPHVADPNFFALTGDEPEREQLRRDALDDFLRSAKDAGLSEDDVEAAIVASEDEIDEMYSTGFGDDEGAAPLEQQATDLSQSLREAGVPEAEIEHMVQELSQSMDESTEEFESELPPDLPDPNAPPD